MREQPHPNLHASLQPMDAPSSELAATNAQAGPPPQGVEAFLAAQGPILDVRSPAEYRQGHIPGATNLPLFDDGERAEIGTLYKQDGRQAAVMRGLALVGPRMERLATTLAAAAARIPDPRQHSGGATPPLARNASGASGPPPLRIHCWRGGMRSGSVAWLAGQLDLPVLLLEGGYKTYRHWVLERFEQAWPLRLLGGRTGCGKTDLLLALRERGVAVLDLEGRAHHRGSSFGALGLPPQPSSEHYENLLAADLAGLKGAAEIWLEAESSQVGRCRIPPGLWRQMKEAPALEIQRPLGQRVAQLVAIYGQQDPAGLAEATQRIAKRLGPQRTALALEAIAASDWASACHQMLDYYDRCYDHDLSSHAVQSVDLGELEPTEAAGLLLDQRLVLRHGPPTS
jgi:tRNA 2-selenouridine synthase